MNTNSFSHARIKASLYINYFVFAILLNSVGIVILKSQKIYGVDEVEASTLELFKDLPIALVSFFVASFIPRIGYKKAMLIALGIVSLGCLNMFFGNSFLSAKILFAMVGLAFALIKISVYSSIGLVTNTEKEHNSLMSSIEGFFMFGIALAYFIFPAFNSVTESDAWLRVYILLTALCIASMLFLLPTKFDSTIDQKDTNLSDDFLGMIKLMIKPLVLVFVLSAFLFVMVEQGIMTWLPSFNEGVLNVSDDMAIMMSSILAISLGIGRFLAGILAKKVSWFWILIVCVIISMLMIIFILPMAIHSTPTRVESFSQIPLMGFVFPMIGLFIAPIYPLLNSVVLSAMPQESHSSMSGLIILFSALGGTLGSRLIGILFKYVGGDTAFFYTLIPMGMLLLSIFLLHKFTTDLKRKTSTELAS